MDYYSQIFLAVKIKIKKSLRLFLKYQYKICPPEIF
jgi:hypothetical protein